LYSVSARPQRGDPSSQKNTELPIPEESPHRRTAEPPNRRKLTREQANQDQANQEQRLTWIRKTLPQRPAAMTARTKRMDRMRGIDVDELAEDYTSRRKG
jgi:hypothetical protein